MAYTVQEALGKIGTPELSTVADFVKLVEDTSAAAKGATADAVSLLYSNSLPNGEPAYKVLDPISESSRGADGLKRHLITHNFAAQHGSHEVCRGRSWGSSGQSRSWQELISAMRA